MSMFFDVGYLDMYDMYDGKREFYIRIIDFGTLRVYFVMLTIKVHLDKFLKMIKITINTKTDIYVITSTD